MQHALCRFGIIFLFTCASLTASAQEPGWITDYNRLLGKYVTSSGVRYADWKGNAADVQALDGVVGAIAKEQVGSLNKNAQLAFYVNAYNAWILHEALAKYPTKSVKDTLFTFFTGKRITVAGEQMSFNRLEKEIIRPKFAEARVHFALNCASRSCPPLQAQAFDGGKIDAQMEKLAKAFVNTDNGVAFNQANKTAQLSKIFDWYKDDFAKEGGALAFINKRRTSPIPADVKISFQDYDWSLNEAR